MSPTTDRQQRFQASLQGLENPYELAGVPSSLVYEVMGVASSPTASSLSSPSEDPANGFDQAPIELDTIHPGEARQVKPAILPVPVPPPAFLSRTRTNRAAERLAARYSAYPQIAETSRYVPSPLVDPFGLDGMTSRRDIESQLPVSQRKKKSLRRWRPRFPKSVCVALFGVIVPVLLITGLGVWASELQKEGKLGVYWDKGMGECRILGGLRVGEGMCGNLGGGESWEGWE
ncbi:hypothetical protein CKM354_001017100 [Cercospora kikuchii]|uniref:Uncharacterized protein n=1 Tax=Cercospora kikuchii TaxID=84275 RepID=A0A9P3FKR9_9PEZI|nr:uncharacterized protein CKM354_001017100 [Cercospora kikuchii]GIZ47070.1 hypothetical protein CKM354_001017100 [Cercospora kikuchii]